MQKILKKLPYDEPFLFVDEIDFVSADEIRGNYTFQKDAFFYKGHFKNFPITPGVILTECMAQIGLVCLGIYLTDNENRMNCGFVLSHTDIDFLKAVYPGEKVAVVSKKIYFRFNKLKCNVKMFNSAKEIVVQGTISGMLKPEMKLEKQ